jgi:uncharacterized YigZ family protein
MDDSWKTVQSPAEGQYKEKGSRFLAFIYPVSDEEEIRSILTSVRKEHHSARHHCYAWRLGTENILSRASDDGEPSSTAGKPILSQLAGNELTNILLIVVRYFGGTLLGTSGLIRAYREASADAIRNAQIETRTMLTRFSAEFPYSSLNAVMQTLKNENIEYSMPSMAESCFISFTVPVSKADDTEILFKYMPEVRLNRN